VRAGWTTTRCRSTRRAGAARVARRAGAATLLVIVWLPSCTPTVWTDYRFEGGERVIAEEDLPPLTGASKAAVLGHLGPPGQVVAQDHGDLFVYWRQSLDLDFFQVNPGLVTPVLVPVYGDYDGRWRDRRLYVAFDREGRVSHVSWADGQELEREAGADGEADGGESGGGQPDDRQAADRQAAGRQTDDRQTDYRQTDDRQTDGEEGAP